MRTVDLWCQLSWGGQNAQNQWESEQRDELRKWEVSAQKPEKRRGYEAFSLAKG